MNLAAERVCELNGRSFAKLFQRQYSLSETPGPCPEGWLEKRHAGWQVCHCPDLPVTDITDQTGAILGWFIGIGIDPDGRMFSDSAVLPATSGAPGFWQSVETLMSGLAGRYLALVWQERSGRAYTDPCCDMALVYDPVGRMAGSSLLLALRREVEENALMPARGPVQGKHNYALQQTPDRHARRAMGNHYLCLDRFEMHRFFPAEDTVVVQGADALQPTCERIADRLKTIMTALAQRYSCVIPITGGRDSRLVVSACEGRFADCRFYVHHTGNFATGLDCLVAGEIAQRLGIDLDIVDVAAPEHRPKLQGRAARQRRWDFVFANGYQTSGKNPGDRLAPLLAPRGEVLIRGNVMELLRANQWKRGEFDRISIPHGLSKLRVAARIDEDAIAIWGPRYEDWMASLPEGAQERALDFAFCELLLPNTMGAMLSASTTNFTMNAFNDRSLIMAALSLPPKLRRHGQVVDRLMQLLAHDLADISFGNDPEDLPGRRKVYNTTFKRVHWNAKQTEAR